MGIMALNLNRPLCVGRLFCKMLMTVLCSEPRMRSGSS